MSWATFSALAQPQFVRREASRGAVQCGAIYDPGELYRYVLWRGWSEAPPLVACLLNPSKATEMATDNTVTRFEKWARAWGYGGLVVVNAFALRSTDPAELYRAQDPVGEGTALAHAAVAGIGGRIVVGWGRHVAALERRGHRGAQQLEALLLEHSTDGALYALAVNADGSPAHPRGLRNDLTPVLYRTLSRGAQ